MRAQFRTAIIERYLRDLEGVTEYMYLANPTPVLPTCKHPRLEPYGTPGSGSYCCPDCHDIFFERHDLEGRL